MTQEREATPALPYKASGQIWHMGWDIPTEYCIDADNICWVNGAHGGDPYKRVGLQELFDLFEEEDGANELRRILGLEPQYGWMRAARAAGWLPPK